MSSQGVQNRKIEVVFEAFSCIAPCTLIKHDQICLLNELHGTIVYSSTIFSVRVEVE